MVTCAQHRTLFFLVFRSNKRGKPSEPDNCPCCTYIDGVVSVSAGYINYCLYRTAYFVALPLPRDGCESQLIHQFNRIPGTWYVTFSRNRNSKRSRMFFDLFISSFPVYIAAPTSRVGRGGVLIIMHGRNRITINPRTPTMPGRNTPGFHRAGRHCLHQVRSAVRCWASRMKVVLHPTKNRC